MSGTIVMQKKNQPPRLLVFYRGHFSQVGLASSLLIGRTPERQGGGLALPCGFVSRRHGVIQKNGQAYFYTDLNSANGTFHNGKRLTSNVPCRLTSGDVLHIYGGKHQFVCLIFSTEYPARCGESSIVLRPSIAEINVGRSGPGIQMTSQLVSANHASFFIAREGWAVTDHRSTNGVYLNNCRLTRPRYLRVGDCVRLANLHFIYTGSSLVFQTAASPLPGTGEPLQIHIVERSVWQRAKKLMLLQNINMTIQPGELVLILGGSGAGKTTFMNAVMGYEKAEGKIMHGSTDIYEDFKSMKYKIGFVPQQDLLRGSDTVYNTLKNAAQLKMPRSTRAEERTRRIETVLDTLGLSRERDSLVSKLSGGQRKRLSIAVEYVSNPSLFFLDEPDSGLDGIMAKSLMKNLRTIADEGKIVMVISHAPDRAAQLFDKVIVLAKSSCDNCGHLAFFGSVPETLRFFGADTLESVVKRINRRDEGGDGLADYFIRKYNAQL